jgi:hypothetical protein
MLKKYSVKTKLTTTIPPKSGPQPQGLNISYNTVKTIQAEKINGRQHRQGATKRRATTNIT